MAVQLQFLENPLPSLVKVGEEDRPGFAIAFDDASESYLWVDGVTGEQSWRAISEVKIDVPSCFFPRADADDEVEPEATGNLCWACGQSLPPGHEEVEG